MIKAILIFLFSFTCGLLTAQNINFTDLRLKLLLTSIHCVDTNNNGVGDVTADFNNDGEIQFTEALTVKRLIFDRFPDTFHVKSVQDLANFSHLEKLKILYFDSVKRFENLGLDSLNTLWIAASNQMKHVDISDIPRVEHLRIEGILPMDYLNLRNGNYADSVFSLFYTEQIEYACIDSVAGEINALSWRMKPGKTVSFNCLTDLKERRIDAAIFSIFPNPTANVIYLKSDLTIISVQIRDYSGRLVYTGNSKEIDVARWESGLYTVVLTTKDGRAIEKFIKN